MTRSRFLMLAAAVFSALSVELLAAAAPAATTLAVAATTPPVTTVATPMALVAAAGAPAEPLMRVLFTWIGSDNDAWRDATNWTSMGCINCFPDDASDDALIDVFDSEDPFDIGLSADTTIDDLTVTENDAGSLRITHDSAVTLTCDTITISCTDNSGFVRLIAHNRVKIETN